jgi:DNA-binding transcriptional MerR regulator/methylmalonyl-CoA mutase cobalamin-binding subunit
MENEKRYTIKIASQRTGLSTHVIRAWEKRYAVIEPARTETNRRLYSEQDIEYLTLLRQLTSAGHPISSLAGLPLSELKKMLGAEHRAVKDEDPSAREDQSETARILLDQTLQAVRNFDVEVFEKQLNAAALQLPQPILIHELINPLVDRLGEMWRDGLIRIMHEHMATAVLMPFLARLRATTRPDSKAPLILVTTPLGQKHEIGALIIAVLAASEGWRVMYLGADLPAEEIAAAALDRRPKAIALSIVYPANDPYLSEELHNLKQSISADVKIIVGGRVSASYQGVLQEIGAIRLEDMRDFRNVLAGIEQQ